MSFNPFIATVGNQPTPLPVSAGGTGLTSSPITIALGGTGQTALAASVNYKPSDPTATASTTPVFMGLGTTCVFTPLGSGIVRVDLTCQVITETAIVQQTMIPKYAAGTGGASTTVAAGSNGGTISGIAAWANPSAGVLAVASTAGFPASGTLWVAASGSTIAQVTYTGTSGGNQFTGCAYVQGSAVGTVATGGAVTGAPQNGGTHAGVGTVFGTKATGAIIRGAIASTTANQQFGCTDRLALAAGTAYWFDVAMGTNTGADAALMQNVSMVIEELIA